MSDYADFLKSKKLAILPTGREIGPEDIHPLLFPFQRDIVRWATRKGRCAVFADTGLGKTYIQLEWARLTGKRTLIIAPLSVARQTVRMASNLGLTVHYTRSGADLQGDLNITNYEMIDHFDPADFGAVVLDESSILKALDGKTRNRLTEMFAGTPYRLCCTATPAPNDLTELGNHAEFLGICSEAEMRAMFFINANKEYTTFDGNGTAWRRKGSNKGGQEWRLKHPAEKPFFRWLASWAVCITTPSDLGYDDDGFILPPLNIQTQFVKVDYVPDDQLLFTHLHGIADRADIRRKTLDARLDALQSIVGFANSESVCYNLGHEQERLHAAMVGSKQGSCQGVQRDNERQAQCEAPGTICPGRAEENYCSPEIQRVAEKTSRKEEGAETPGIPDNLQGLCGIIGETGGPVRDLRLLGCEQAPFLSGSGSFPCNGQGKGHTVCKLQSCSREIQGQPRSVACCRELSGDQWVIWCGLDAEQDAVSRILGDDCISIYGSLSPEEKERRLETWLAGDVRFLVSKPRVCGFGLNLQQSHNMAFFGLNDSWENWYQCIRREYRFGQAEPVNVHVIMSDLEAEIYQNVQRKDAMAARLRRGLIAQVRDFEREELVMDDIIISESDKRTAKGLKWTAMLGDSCERLKEIADDSVDLSVYSPPFADLYTYTDSERDLGNSKDWAEFFEHYQYIIREVLRVTKPGRLTCVHTSDIPAMQSRDGWIGVKDFPGEVIRAYEKEDWTFVGRAFVQKNPQAQAIRVKSKALLFVQLRKDSADSRPALVDQVLLFKKDGENAAPVLPVENGELDNEKWIEWAHGIWLGIHETDTLQYSIARGEDDEKHICPLQLGTIERCIKLYSNPGETVLTPFGGIGSEGYQAVKFGRRAILIELKPEYFDVLVRNMQAVEAQTTMPDLFSWAEQRSCLTTTP